MIRLYAKIQSTSTEVLLDTLGDENISLELAIDDIQSTEGKNTGYTKDFQLPATNINNQFFEHYYSVDRSTNTFNPYKRVECRLEVNGLNILEGFFILIDVNKKGQDYFYKIVAYDKVANLFDILGDATINDLNFGDIQHIRYTTQTAGQLADVDNITASFNGNIATDNLETSIANYVSTGSTNAVMYNLVANSEFYDPFVNASNVAQNNFYHAIEVANTPMCLQLKYVINKIFSFAGFAYDSTFFNDATYFEKIYFDTTTQRNTFISQGNANDDYVKVSVNDIDDSSATGYPINITPYYNFLNYAFTQENTSNAYNLGTDTYVAPFDGNLDVTHRARIKNTTSSIKSIIFIAEVTNSNVLAAGDYIIDSHIVAANVNTNFNFSGSLTVDAGATIKFKFFVYAAGLQFTNTLDYGVLYNPHNQLSIHLQPADSPDTAIKQRIGEIKLVDILRDTFKLFNLVAEPTARDTVLKIEPYSTFTSQGTIVDFTDKLDMTNAIVQPIQVPANISLNFAEDSDDYYLSRYKNITNKDYGNFTVQTTSESTSELKIELEVFSPAYVQEYEGTQYLGYFCHIGKEEDEAIVGYENKPRLFFKNNTVFDLLGNQRIILGYTPTQNNHILAKWSSSYHYYNDVLNSSSSSVDTLTFGIVNPIYTPDIENIPVNTLHSRWYEDYFAERYDSIDGLLYTVKMDLNAQDIYNFTFANTIRVDEQLYRVNKIQYNTDKNKLSTVELYRL